MIQDLSHTSQWRYISSKENPADSASRGLHVESFLRSRWLKGPEYLSRERRTWPKVTQGLGEISANDPEVRKAVTVNSVEKEITVNSVRVENQHPICTLIKYHSSWNQLQKSVAWILKVKRILQLLSQLRKNQTHVSSETKRKVKDKHGTQNLSVEDMQEAERAIIFFEQRRYFSHEFTHLENGKTLSSRSTIHKLDPILDNGILRVGGRINKSAMPVHQKNPIILPKGSHSPHPTTYPSSSWTLRKKSYAFQAKAKVLDPSCKLLSEENPQKLCILQTHAGTTWRTENGRSPCGSIVSRLTTF